MAERRSPAKALLLALIAFGVGALASALLFSGQQRSGAPEGGPPGAVEIVDGVPVGVLDTPQGALAAADNYLAEGSQTVEQDPRAFEALVAADYAPEARRHTLSEAGRLRTADPQDETNYAEGGRGLAVIAARRLDRYTSQSATVTTWLGGFVWGPHLAPRQTWNLVDTTLVWGHGRWLIASAHTDATPAPVPAIVYVQGGNDRPQAFSELSGMSAPFYGAAG